MTGDGRAAGTVRCVEPALLEIVRSSPVNASRNSTCRLLSVIALLIAYAAQFYVLMMYDFDLLRFLQNASFLQAISTGVYQNRS